jgi:hypothetical protein
MDRNPKPTNGGTAVDEKTFFEYEDVKVTNARFISGGQTYAMSNVTSVKSREESPSRVGPALVLLFCLGAFMAENYFFGIVLGALGLFWLIKQKAVYHVMLSTAGGETSALKTNQPEYLSKVVKALNDAIVYRG